MASSLLLSACRRSGNGMKYFPVCAAPSRKLADSALAGRVRLVAGVGYPVFPRARQSVGFRVLDQLAKNSGVEWKLDEDVGGHVCQVSQGDVSLVLLKPNYPGLLTYSSVEKALKKLGLRAEDLTVVRDDPERDIGSCGVEKAEDMRGSEAVKNIIIKLKTDSFKHVCVGIGLPADGRQLRVYVREDFTTTELDGLAEGVDKAAKLLMKSH